MAALVGRLGLWILGLAALPLLHAMDGGTNENNHQYWRRWTDAEIAEKKAEAWEDDTWTTPPFTTWDGMTSATSSAEGGVSSSSACPPSASSSMCVHGQGGVLQAGGQLAIPAGSCSSSSTAPTSSAWDVVEENSSCCPLSRHPTFQPDATAWDEDISLAMQELEVQEFVEDGALAPIPEDLPLPFGSVREPMSVPALEEENRQTPGSEQAEQHVDWWEQLLDRRALRGRMPVPPSAGNPGRDPTELATPKSRPQPDNVQAEQGITQRGSKIRTGVDRWHHADGSIRNRRRERLAAEAAAAEATDGETMEEEAGTPGASSSSSQLVSFYKQPLGCRADDSSTTAGEVGRSSTVDTSSNSSSTSAPTVVGFWKNGQWIARARTPVEERAHRGGSGPRRTQRKQERVQAYFAGDWKPAWLRDYISDKMARTQNNVQCERAEQESDGPSRRQDQDSGMEAKSIDEVSEQLNMSAQTVPPEPTTYTDPDPWSGQWHASDNQWWWDAWTSTSSWWDGWSWSTSSSTSPPGNLQELGGPWPENVENPPNFGLFPEVHEVGHEAALAGPEDDDVWRMQLTNAEGAMLRDMGVPERAVHRLEEFFQRLEDYDSFELGPEARWGLARLTRRADEGIESLGAVLEVMLRRLRPRGRWPVVRTPRAEMDQWRMFNWVRNFGDIFVLTLQHNLDVRLQPREDLGMVEGVGTRDEEAEQLVEPPTPVVENQELGEDTAQATAAEAGVEPEAEPLAGNADQMASASPGPSSSLQPAEPSRSRSRSPNPPARLRGLMAVDGLRRALNGELLGVWADEEAMVRPTTTTSSTWGEVWTPHWLEANSSSSTSSTPSSSTASSSSTSTGSSDVAACGSLPIASPCTPSCPMATCGILSPTAFNSAASAANASLALQQDPQGFVDVLSLLEAEMTIWWSMSTPSTPSTSWTTSTIVAREMTLSGEADVVEVLHRLLARSRLLLRYQQNLALALEEILRWLPVPTQSVPFNAPTIDAQLWQAVSHAASTGSTPASANPEGTPASSAPLVLLQPRLPDDGEALRDALPGFSGRTIAGLRRRVWRQHVHGVAPSLAASDAVHAASHPADPGDCDLYLLQADAGRPVPLSVAGLRLLVQSRRGVVQHRRRVPGGRRRVPAGRVRASPSGPSERERSRSRDG